MSYKIFINDIEIDVIDNENIARTLQVNDVANLATRQTNFTTNIKAPFTAKNVKAFNYLGVIGNDSNLPYQMNVATIIDENGEALVYKGFATFTSTSDNYSINIYDGNIDFYKAIENQTLSELDLTELNHEKSLATVQSSWTTNSNYKYILADYNGKTTYDIDKLNIDYLVPSVNVKYLWDKIFDKYGFTYTGAIFNTPDFTNLYMSYPKGITTSDSSITIFSADEARLPTTGSIDANGRRFAFPTVEINLLESLFANVFLKVADTDTYRIEIDGKINTSGATTFKLALGKNQSGTVIGDEFIVLNAAQEEGVDFNIQKTFILNAGEDINVMIKAVSGNFSVLNSSSVSVKLSKVQSNQIDFGDVFSEFSIKDFFNEILWRFGLTSFKNKYTNGINFLTQNEQYTLNENNVIDWSEKFVEKENENYQLGNYAKKNTFKYKYNDDQESHNDGFFSIDDYNLQDEKIVIQSKIYSPEKQLTDYFGRSTNVYKFWDKEVSENSGTQQIKYKSLDKRFYFLRSQDYNFSVPQTIGSEQFNEETVITTAPVESFANLTFKDVIKNYYSATRVIVDKSLLMKVKLHLTDFDITNFDFEKIYFIKQLGGYFSFNKVNSYRTNKLTSCEVIRLNNPITNYEPIEPPEPEQPTTGMIRLRAIVTGYDEFSSAVQLNYSFVYTPLPTELTLQLSEDNGVTWTSSAITVVQQPETPLLILLSNGVWKIRLLDESLNYVSNTKTVSIGQEV